MPTRHVSQCEMGVKSSITQLAIIQSSQLKQIVKYSIKGAVQDQPGLRMELINQIADINKIYNKNHIEWSMTFIEILANIRKLVYY
jgi:hypothetical protein